MPSHTLHTNFAIIEVKGDAAADLLAELHHERYEGPTTRAVTDQLWLYGWVNLHARLSDGGIAHLGAAPGAREITERDLDRFTIQSTRDDLVCSTLEGAVPKFVSDVLSTGRYDPHRDTTIATYFTNYTFRRFRSQIHPKWADETRRHEYELGAVQTTDEWYSAAGTTPDHADDVLHALSAHQTAVYVIKHFANLTERPVALGVLRGQTHNEIAADLGNHTQSRRTPTRVLPQQGLETPTRHPRTRQRHPRHQARHRTQHPHARRRLVGLGHRMTPTTRRRSTDAHSPHKTKEEPSCNWTPPSPQTHPSTRKKAQPHYDRPRTPPEQPHTPTTPHTALIITIATAAYITIWTTTGNADAAAAIAIAILSLRPPPPTP